MSKATEIMKQELINVSFHNSNKTLISNVTANEVSNNSDMQKLLVSQIEQRVRWRESINFMISKGVNRFIEIGPGKVLSGLIKRIDRNVKVSAINNEMDINSIKLNN